MAARANDPEFVVVGHLSKPHGTKGELYIWPLTDAPERTYTPDVEFWISDRQGSVPDPDFPRVRIATSRPYRRGFLVRFEGFDDRDGADLLRDRYLLRPFSEAAPLETGEIFYHQLLGLEVRTTAGRKVGKVREVYGVNPADLLDVQGEDGSHLIPFTKEVIVDWDVDEGWLTIDPPDGLLDL